MEIPKGIRTKNKGDYVQKVEKNIYGQKQAGRVWNQHLVRKLVNEVGFKQSEQDECLFYKGNVIYLLYTDDSILTGPDDEELDRVMREIADSGLDITQERLRTGRLPRSKHRANCPGHLPPVTTAPD